MRNPKKTGVAAAALTTLALVASTTAALAANFQATQTAMYQTSTWTPPSSDPSGITFIPGKGLLVSDAEIEEVGFTGPITHNNNLFQSSVTGVRTGGGSTVGWSNEPTGVAFVSATGSPWTGHLFVTDDDQKRVYDISGAGADGQFGTADDGGRTFFRTSAFGNTDPEDVAFDSHRNELWIAGGLSTIISRVNPGPDGKFDTVQDNITKNFSLPHLDPDPLKPPSPEGMAYDPARQTILVLDGEAGAIFEFARNGALLNTIFLANIDMQSPGGITLDPASTGPNRTYYLADRGLDPNGTRPATCTPVPPATDCEAFNDGVIHEIRVTNLPAIGNLPPLADAGEELIADTNEAVTLLGSGEDGTDPSSPQPLRYTWTRASGPGTVTIGTPNQATTTATFAQAGNHVMQLTVSDGALSHVDQVVVHVFAPGAPRTVDIPIRNGNDDGQETLGGAQDGFTDLESADNELGNTGAVTPANVMTGLRFTNLPVPRGSIVNSAKVQFSADEVGSTPASYVIKGHLSGDAPPFIHGRTVPGANKNMSLRPPTAASVAWNNVPPWAVVRDEGPAQLTPELAPIVQEIIGQPTWARGNAVVFTIQNAAGNGGRRTAEAKDGRIPPYLRIRFQSPLANIAPIVEAGSNSAVTMPGLAALDGTVTDDGRARPFTTTWSKVSGPGNVSFGNAGAVDTTASFSQAGSYVLRLTADDGVHIVSDTVTVTVSAAGPTTPGGVVTPSLTAQAASSAVGVKKQAVITGALSPAFAGQRVTLQRRSGSRWVDVSHQTVGAASSSSVRFTTTSTSSGSTQYRLSAPATTSSKAAISNTVTVQYYQVSVKRVLWKAGVVKVKNTGKVMVNLDGWTLKNKKNGKSATLSSFELKPGKVVKIHTGDGRTNKKHLFLDTTKMWGKHGKAILTDAVGSRSNRLPY